MKKLNNLSKDDKKKEVETIEAQSAAMGYLDSWCSPKDSERVELGLKEMIGLCSDCNNLEYCKTEFGNVHAKCEYFEIRLTGRNRIKECNKYSKRGTMSLRDAMDLAWIIDNETPNKIGF